MKKVVILAASLLLLSSCEKVNNSRGDTAAAPATAPSGDATAANTADLQNKITELTQKITELSTQINQLIANFNNNSAGAGSSLAQQQAQIQALKDLITAAIAANQASITNLQISIQKLLTQVNGSGSGSDSAGLQNQITQLQTQLTTAQNNLTTNITQFRYALGYNVVNFTAELKTSPGSEPGATSDLVDLAIELDSDGSIYFFSPSDLGESQASSTTVTDSGNLVFTQTAHKITVTGDAQVNIVNTNSQTSGIIGMKLQSGDSASSKTTNTYVIFYDLKTLTEQDTLTFGTDFYGKCKIGKIHPHRKPHNVIACKFSADLYAQFIASSTTADAQTNFSVVTINPNTTIGGPTTQIGNSLSSLIPNSNASTVQGIGSNASTPASSAMIQSRLLAGVPSISWPICFPSATITTTTSSTTEPITTIKTTPPPESSLLTCTTPAVYALTWMGALIVGDKKIPDYSALYFPPATPTTSATK